MIFPRKTTFHATEMNVMVANVLDFLRSELIGARFDREKSARIVADGLAGFGLPPDLLSPDAILAGELFASRSLLLAEDLRWQLLGYDLPDGGACLIPLEPPQLLALGDLCRADRSDDEARLRSVEMFDSALVGSLFRDARPTSRWPETVEPGLYRREHASLVVRSKTTTLIVDPIPMMAMLPRISETPLDPTTRPDAILVTHSHWDHWNLPSLLRTAGDPKVPVIVPAVPRRNLLCESDFAEALAAVGQHAVRAPWHSTHRIGDIEIDVLPFYGEQPTRDDAPALEGLRSWGNCYRFNTPDFSAIILVDSGVDALGSAASAVLESVRRHGPPDVLLSCLRSFACPFFGGLPLYWATLPFARLEELFALHDRSALPSTTAGTEGIAALCAEAGIPRFMPYAHGFEGIGAPIGDIGWGEGEPSEADAASDLQARLEKLGAPTKVLRWNTGEVARFGNQEVRIAPWCEVRSDDAAIR